MLGHGRFAFVYQVKFSREHGPTSDAPMPAMTEENSTLDTATSHSSTKVTSPIAHVFGTPEVIADVPHSTSPSTGKPAPVMPDSCKLTELAPAPATAGYSFTAPKDLENDYVVKLFCKSITDDSVCIGTLHSMHPSLLFLGKWQHQ